MNTIWSLQHRISTALCLVPGTQPTTDKSIFSRGWDLRSRIERGEFAGLKPAARPGTILVPEFGNVLKQYRESVGPDTTLLIDAHGWQDLPKLAPRTNPAEHNQWRLDYQEPLDLSPALLVMGSCYAGSEVYREALRNIVTPGTPTLACSMPVHVGEKKGQVCDVRTVIEPALHAFAQGHHVDPDVVEPAQGRGWRLFSA